MLSAPRGGPPALAPALASERTSSRCMPRTLTHPPPGSQTPGPANVPGLSDLTSCCFRRPPGSLSPKHGWPKDPLGQCKPASSEADPPGRGLTALTLMDGRCPVTLVTLDVMTTGRAVGRFPDACAVLNALHVPRSTLRVYSASLGSRSNLFKTRIDDPRLFKKNKNQLTEKPSTVFQSPSFG